MQFAKRFAAPVAAITLGALTVLSVTSTASANEIVTSLELGSATEILPDLDPAFTKSRYVLSPDGQYIVFSALSEDRTLTYLTPLAGGDPIRLGTGDESVPWVFLAFSPDSQYAIYESRVGDGLLRAQPVGGGDATLLDIALFTRVYTCLLYTSPSPRDS